MNTVSVRTDRRLHAFTLDRQGDRWFVDVGGRRCWATLVPVGSRWSLLVGEGGADAPARSYEVTFEHGSVVVNGCQVAARVARPSDRGFGDAAFDEPAGPAAITSPMPGRVVRMLVKAGDIVEERQSLVIVEAMKMQNEIRAPRAGVVAEVRVAEGAPVEARAVLVVLE